jgi:OPA family glycerol-3-phosphate transporter-like MFS transporter 3
MKSHKLWQAVIFFVSFLAMLARHACLGAWSMSKTHIGTELGFTSAVFGTLDSVYLVCYSIGNFICGSMADRYPVRLVMAAGATLASVCYFLVLASQIAVLGNYQVTMVLPFAVLFGIGGIAQSGIFPGGVSVVSSWFEFAVRGKVMGFWSSSASLGDATGQVVSGLMFGVFLMTWEEVLSAHTVLLLLSGLLCLLFIRDRPVTSVTFATSELTFEQQINEQLSLDDEPVSAIGFWKAFLLPR